MSYEEEYEEEPDYDMDNPFDRLRKRFDQFADDFSGFDQVENKRSAHSDIHAFIRLNEILPSHGRIIAAAEHDIIYLNVDVEEFEAIVTDDQILELSRCGVMCDEEGDGLGMFV